MHLKKIYLEVTNRCNFNCNFCIKNKRNISDISIDNYKYVINKIKNITDEVYLHVLGEPLLHKDINYLINYANDNKLLVNITTNGYLIDNISDNHNIHRLNISLHSFNQKYNLSLIDYLDRIFEVIEKIRDKTFVSLRIWVKDKNTNDIIRHVNNKYGTNIEVSNVDTKIKVTKNLIIDIFHEFIWPSLNNDYYNLHGTCKGLIDHMGILVDGSIIPCCLDSLGTIKLGNIYTDDLVNIYNSNIVQEMINGFRNNFKCQELCRHCKFLNKN